VKKPDIGQVAFFNNFPLD